TYTRTPCHPLDAPHRLPALSLPDALPTCERDGAGAAVAFRAALLRAGAPQVLAQELEHGARGIDVSQLDELAVEQEPDGAGILGDAGEDAAHGSLRVSYRGKSNSSTAIPAGARGSARRRAPRAPLPRRGTAGRRARPHARRSNRRRGTRARSVPGATCPCRAAARRCGRRRS